MFERLSGEYNRGYREAIMDVIEIFNYVQDDLTGHKKRMNGRLAKDLLAVILQEREKIREDRDGFFRWNNKLNGFEWFSRKDFNR